MSIRNAAPPGPFAPEVLKLFQYLLMNTGMLVPYAPETHASMWTPHLDSSGVARTQLSRRNPDIALPTIGATNSALLARFPCWRAVVIWPSNVDLSSVPTDLFTFEAMNS